MEFPQVDLPVDMIAWTEVTEDILNIYKQSCRLKACIFALCIEGSITVSINLMDTEIKQGDFITLLPGTIIQFYEQKEKVCLGFVGFSSHCLNGVNLIQSTLSSFSNILEYPVLAVNPTVASYFKDYFALWAPQHHREAGDRQKCIGHHRPRRHRRRESQAEINQHDHSGDCLFPELPQCFLLWKILQEAHGHESAGV